MAGFCRNCGAPIEDDARVCGQCGVPITPGGMAPKLNIPKVGEINSQTKDKAKKIGLIAGIAVLAIILLVIIFRIVGANTGYKATLKKFFKGLQNGDSATMVSCLSEYIVDWGDNYSGSDIEEIADDYIDSSLDAMEDEVGANPKISVEIRKESKLSDRKIDKLKEMIEDRDDDYDVDSITAGVNVDLRLNIKGRDDTEHINMDNFCLVKESGKWRIIGFDGYGLVP